MLPCNFQDFEGEDGSVSQIEIFVIPKEDYKYYYVDPEIKPPQIAHRFEPDDEIMFFRAKNSKERLVFPINEQYDSDEEEEIDKFDQY